MSALSFGQKDGTIFIKKPSTKKVSVNVNLVSGKSFQNINRLYGRDTSLYTFVNDSILYTYFITADSFNPNYTYYYYFDGSDKDKCLLTLFNVIAINDDGSIITGNYIQEGIIKFNSKDEFILRVNSGQTNVRPTSFNPPEHEDNVTFVKSRF
jgi:hypothetical protein